MVAVLHRSAGANSRLGEMTHRPDDGHPSGAGLLIVAPPSNEARPLPGTFPRLIADAANLSEPAEVIVVDDGSDDGTGEIAASLGEPYPFVTVLRSGRKRGKRHAVRRGVLAARFSDVLFTDVYLSTSIEETAVLRAALAAGADVAIGSQRRARSDIQVQQPWLRELAGRTFSGLVVLLLLAGIHDSQCGFKAVLGRVRLKAWTGRYGLERSRSPAPPGRAP